MSPNNMHQPDINLPTLAYEAPQSQEDVNLGYTQSQPNSSPELLVSRGPETKSLYSQTYNLGSSQSTATMTPATHFDPPPAPRSTDSPVVIEEKEWVAKAKQIVDQKKSDPRQESNGLNVLRRDYLKLKYQETLKLSEDPE